MRIRREKTNLDKRFQKIEHERKRKRNVETRKRSSHMVIPALNLNQNVDQGYSDDISCSLNNISWCTKRLLDVSGNKVSDDENVFCGLPPIVDLGSGDIETHFSDIHDLNRPPGDLFIVEDNIANGYDWILQTETFDESMNNSNYDYGSIETNDIVDHLRITSIRLKHGLYVKMKNWLYKDV